MEESYKNTNLSPLLSRNTIAHSPDYRQSQGLSPDVAYNYDFTQFLVTKKSMEAEEKKKSFSISYPLEGFNFFPRIYICFYHKLPR